MSNNNDGQKEQKHGERLPKCITHEKLRFNDFKLRTNIYCTNVRIVWYPGYIMMLGSWIETIIRFHNWLLNVVLSFCPSQVAQFHGIELIITTVRRHNIDAQIRRVGGTKWRILCDSSLSLFQRTFNESSPSGAPSMMQGYRRSVFWNFLYLCFIINNSSCGQTIVFRGGQVKSSSGATWSLGDHLDPYLFLPPTLRGLWRGLNGVGH